jgi:hypothetical protein
MLDVKQWRQKFAGTDSDDGEFFDQSFAGLVKASYNQIKPARTTIHCCGFCSAPFESGAGSTGFGSTGFASSFLASG